MSKVTTIDWYTGRMSLMGPRPTESKERLAKLTLFVGKGRTIRWQ